jgi:hypothetical protein
MWRLRRLGQTMGWRASEENQEPARLRRHISWVVVGFLTIDAIRP